MDIILQRVYLKDKTLGKLGINGQKICDTVEMPWRKNKRFISCIPEGRYRVVQKKHPQKGMQLVLAFVPKREEIMLNPPDFSLSEIQGCIATVETSGGEVKYSAIAFREITKVIMDIRKFNKPVYIVIRSK